MSEIDPVDTHVGERVRLARRLVEMSQAVLAQACDITFQQVQKYEGGTNRVSASRLHQIARTLEKPISFFFEGLPDYPVTTPLTDSVSLRIVERLGKLTTRERAAVAELVEAVARKE